MKENQTMDGIHRQLLKKYHTLCTALGLGAAEKEAIVAAYGVESSRDLDTHDLVDLCAKLSEQAGGEKMKELDRLRKRAMAAIGAWLRAEGRKEGSAVIKAIACRATGHADFNRIPKERLRNVIHLFGNKTRDRKAVEDIVEGGSVVLTPRVRE